VWRTSSGCAASGKRRVVKVLFDTNILIDYLRGFEQADQEINLYSDKAISVITWIEVIAGTTPANENLAHAFLSTFQVLPLGAKEAQRAVLLRQTKRTKLPDALIWATAQVNDRLLISRNTKDFAANEPGVRVPYVLIPTL
jgi:predicted nucleic acid-binding protein